jgi:hypothetical protein
MSTTINGIRPAQSRYLQLGTNGTESNPNAPKPAATPTARDEFQGPRRDYSLLGGGAVPTSAATGPIGQQEQAFTAEFTEKAKGAVADLLCNWAYLDRAAGIGGKDQLVGGADFAAALASPSCSESLRNSITFLNENPAAFNRLDANGNRGVELIEALDVFGLGHQDGQHKPW